MGVDNEEEYIVEIGYIGRDPFTEQLYKLEERAVAAFKMAAEEWHKIHGRVGGYDMSTEQGEKNVREFYRRAVTSELYNFLDNWDTNASIAAAKAYLLRRGYYIGKTEILCPGCHSVMHQFSTGSEDDVEYTEYDCPTCPTMLRKWRTDSDAKVS